VRRTDRLDSFIFKLLPVEEASGGETKEGSP